MAEALGRTRLVLTTGGLGPTRDDLSKKVVADLFGLPLEFHEEIWTALVERFARMGRKISDRNRCQAEVPRDATVLPNRWGTAPGLWISGPLGEVIMLPGVPIEMRGLLTHEVLPRLAARAGGLVVRSRMVRTTGIPESSLADQGQRDRRHPCSAHAGLPARPRRRRSPAHRVGRRALRGGRAARCGRRADQDPVGRPRVWRRRGRSGPAGGRRVPAAATDDRGRGVVHRRDDRRTDHRHSGQLGCVSRRGDRLRQPAEVGLRAFPTESSRSTGP